MLSTKNLPESSGIPKTLSPGNRMAKINGITLEEGYNPDSYHIILHLEGVEMGDDFEGFLVDPDDKEGLRYLGQVGRVKMSAWAFEDGEYQGRQYYRDTNILMALKNLAIALGKQEALNEIEADTIEEYVPKAASILADKTTFINFCLCGREYEDKNGYTKFDLYLEKANKNGLPFENPEVEIDKSRLFKFDPLKHIKKKKEPETVKSFEAASENVPALTASADFDMD